MAFKLIAMDLENQAEINFRAQERRIPRNVDDPFDLIDQEFKKLYRLRKDTIYDIICAIGSNLESSRITGIKPEKMVLSSIRFFATGSFQRSVGEQWGISLSQPSVSRCLHGVTDSINQVVLRQWVKFPKTTYERNIMKETFRSCLYPFEGCIGAIDCTHVAILAPARNVGAYVNHHGYHSLNVQTFCDPNLRILNVNAQYGGSRHDSFIWGSRPARTLLENAFNHGERRTFLLYE
ncbi:putative nuclease HARBI1 [Musca domestica]|uniref:Nuclease HARBI1 n=1 Tax=Musca domestica TaxID=7370 RepID=A0ABM3VEB2_MUSDO|nr:putative nuclease HARBI1 [Musca domestica]